MPNRTEIPVAWGDTDAGGLIYYPRFFHYFVVGLNDYFAAAFEGAHPMESLRAAGCTLPAVDASASFSSPLRAGDVAAVTTTVRALGESSLTVGYDVERADDGRHVAAGEVTFVLVDGDFESTPFPGAVRDCVRSRGDANAIE